MRERRRGSRGRQVSLAPILAFVLLLSSYVSSFGADVVILPTSDGGWSLSEGTAIGRSATEPGIVEVRGKGTLGFDPSAIATLRPDVFAPGHFSVFDVLVHLAQSGAVDLEYTFDGKRQTHVIASLNGLEGWWYDAHYEGGSFDRTVVRMDQFPVKDGMTIVVYLEDPERLAAIHEHFREEVARRDTNGGSVVVPTVTLRSSTDTIVFENVLVTAHDTRLDILQPGVVTMLDVLLSLGEQGRLTELGLEWRAEEDDITVIDAYYVVSITADEFAPERTGSCVLTHQIRGATIAGFLPPHAHTMSHVHLTADLEVLVSPEAVEWLWVCL